MTEFEQFLSRTERVWGRKIAREAARIWRERGPEAAHRFLRGFECLPPDEPPERPAAP